MQNISCENTVFLWDIHDVILERDLKKLITNIWNYDKKWALLTHLNRFITYEICRACVGAGSTEEILESTQEYNNPFLEELIPCICNAQAPITGTWNIIKAVHQKGFKQYIGSNIGKKIFEQLIDLNKNPSIAPIFNYFDLNQPQVVEIPIIKKPSLQFYYKFLERNNINLEQTQVIFIDDNEANTKAAKKIGLITILFKTPQQLEQELQQMGIDTTLVIPPVGLQLLL